MPVAEEGDGVVRGEPAVPYGFFALAVFPFAGVGTGVVRGIEFVAEDEAVAVVRGGGVLLGVGLYGGCKQGKEEEFFHVCHFYFWFCRAFAL